MLSNPTRSLLLISVGHLTIELSSQFLPVVYPTLIRDLGLSYAQIGLIVFIAGCSTSLTQPFFGLLSDRWHPHLLTAVSIAWTGMFMSLVGFTWDYLSLMLVVAVGALGSAAFHPAGASIASAGGGTRRGAAVSIFSVGGNLGSALSPLWVTIGLGWFGARGTLVLIPVALMVSLLLYRQLGRVRRSEKDPAVARPIAVQERSSVWLVLIVLSMLFRAWFQASFMTYLPTFAQAQGRSSAASGQMLFLFMACVGVGSLIGGALSDRVGRWQVLVLSLALLGPGEWLFLNSSDPFQLALLGAMGVLIGATFPVGIVMAQEAMPRGLGFASGIVIGLPWIGAGIGASITGLIADRFSLQVGMESLVLPAVLSAASILAYAARRRPRNQA